jgi:hypothetical protein
MLGIGSGKNQNTDGGSINLLGAKQVISKMVAFF